jgi:anti-sigma factor RsiW
MSHVDEGTLHALVDNALAEDERRDVEAHVASCGECARRFAEATAMARQVTALLGALDDVGGAVRIVAPSGPTVVADGVRIVPRETNVMPIRRATFTLRRLAIAASVMLVAGVSYQVGHRGDGARERAAMIVPVRAPALSAPMVSTPSVVDAPADSYVAPAPPAARQRAPAGPRNEAEVATSDRIADYASKKASAEKPVTPPAQKAAMQPLPVVSADVAADSGEQRRRDERSSQDALGRVQAQEQARAQQNSPAPDQASRMRNAPMHLGQVVVTGVTGAARAASGSAVAAAPKPTAPKAVPLAGYATTEEESVPGVTRRRYVSASGAALLLLITQPVVEAKSQAGGTRTPEFVITTDSGRSIVRWHARGLDYELQAPLAPDSLMKLATQLK